MKVFCFQNKVLPIGNLPGIHLYLEILRTTPKNSLTEPWGITILVLCTCTTRGHSGPLMCLYPQELQFAVKQRACTDVEKHPGTTREGPSTRGADNPLSQEHKTTDRPEVVMKYRLKHCINWRTNSPASQYTPCFLSTCLFKTESDLMPRFIHIYV